MDILNALRLHHKAKKAEAIANLNILLNNPVGVGEHPQVKEALNWLEKLEGADGSLQTLTRYYKTRE